MRRESAHRRTPSRLLSRPHQLLTDLQQQRCRPAEWPARACAGKRSSRAPSTIDGQNARLSLRSDLPSRNGQRIFDHPGRAHPRAVSRHYSPRGTHQPPRPQPAPAGRRLRTAAPLASVLLRSDHVARGAHGASGAVRGARGELQGRHGPCGSRAEPECRYQDSPVWPSLT